MPADQIISIPADDSRLHAVIDGEMLLRRFDPNNPNSLSLVTVDEGAVPRYRLNSAAFSGFSEDGSSVSRSDILEAAGIARDELLIPPKYVCLAEGEVSAVRAIRVPTAGGGEISPFEVIADSYPARSDPEVTDVAHALIILDVETKAERKIAVGVLARTVFNPLVAGHVPAL